MVSVLVSRPRFALAVRALFHRIVCDGVEMGFLPLRDNRAARHMIYAHNEAATVTEAIDRKPRARRSGLGVARVCCISGLWTRAPHSRNGSGCGMRSAVVALAMLSIVARSMARRSLLSSGRFERAREADAITRSNMRMRAANLATAGVSIPARWSRRKSAQSCR